MEKKEIELSLEKIPETIEYIRAALIKRKVEKKEISRTLLTAEDVLVKMSKRAITMKSSLRSGLEKR